MVEDKSGFIHFSLQAMAQFLKTFSIRGVDASHKTMATICLTRLQLEEDMEHDSYSAFSSYAYQNWRYHCQIAERSSLAVRFGALTSRAARISKMRTASDTLIPNRAQDPVKTEDVQISLLQLNIDSDISDWIVVDTGL